MSELETAAFNLHPIGSGPFKFVEFLTDQHVISEANQEYLLGKPNIETLVYQKVAQDAIPIYLQQSRVDFVEISPEQYPQVSTMNGIDVYKHALRNALLPILTDVSYAFADPRIRYE